MDTAPYTAEILVSNLLLSAGGRQALKVTGSVNWDFLHFLILLRCNDISLILFYYSWPPFITA
jgi:hypothetical protein